MNDSDIQKMFDAANPNITNTKQIDEIFQIKSIGGYFSAVDFLILHNAFNNPNISVKTFLENAWAFPQSIKDHPSIPLFELEDPNWFKDISQYDLVLEKNFEFWRPRFLRSFNMYHRVELAGHPETPEEDLKILSTDSAVLVKLRLARRKILCKELREFLSNDQEMNVRVAVAANEETPLALLYQMYESDTDKPVINAVLQNKNFPPVL